MLPLPTVYKVTVTVLGRIQEYAIGGIPPLSYPFPSPSPPLSFPPIHSLPIASPPFRSRSPLNQLWGSAVSSHNGVRGEALAENEFRAR